MSEEKGESGAIQLDGTKYNSLNLIEREKQGSTTFHPN
jgi:hypothetical protein